MLKTAIFWIRDGVLVNRMHVNPVAFAHAAVRCASSDATALYTELIAFGFETSGISCRDKLLRFNQERSNIVSNVDKAVDYYNRLAGEAATYCEYFSGMPELLSDLRAAGCLNFITSAVEQSVLDEWSGTLQGREIAGFLQEILGQRPGFNKGKEHYSYVLEQFAVERIVYVADARSEIGNASESSRSSSHKMNMVPVGFANVITLEDVADAARLVCCAEEKLFPGEKSELRLNLQSLKMPDGETLSRDLSNAGAKYIVRGAHDDIVQNLRTCLESIAVLNERNPI